MLLFWLLGPYAADAAINLCNCVYLCLLWPYTTSPARGVRGTLPICLSYPYTLECISCSRSGALLGFDQTMQSLDIPLITLLLIKANTEKCSEWHAAEYYLSNIAI